MTTTLKLAKGLLYAALSTTSLGGFVLAGAACTTYTPPPQKSITLQFTSEPSLERT